SQVLGMEDVEVLRKLFESHLRVDLTAIDAQSADKRGIALTPHREGGGITVLAYAAEQTVVHTPIRVGEHLDAAAELALEQSRRLGELGHHAARVLRITLAGRATQVAVRLAVRLHVEALGHEALELLPRH